MCIWFSVLWCLDPFSTGQSYGWCPVCATTLHLDSVRPHITARHPRHMVPRKYQLAEDWFTPLAQAKALKEGTEREGGHELSDREESMLTHVCKCFAYGMCKHN